MNKKNLIYSIMAALLLAVVAILFFAPDVFEGNTLQQHDTLQGIANGQEGKAFHETTGETTRWTDSLFGGMPNFQISPTYPANTMLQWVGTLFTLGLPAPAGLLFAMMFGFFIMGLCFRLKWPLAFFGAIAWGFSSYFIIIIGAGHIWKFITLAYIPPTIGAMHLCYRGKYLCGTALTGLFAALQLQSNHPQMTYYFLFLILFLVIAWLFIAKKEGQIRRWLAASGCVIFAALLALGVNSASLYNTLEYSKETVRGKSTELTATAGSAENAGMDRDAITAWSYGIDETFTLLIPNVKGGATIKPVGGENKMLTIAETPTVQKSYASPEEMQFLGYFPQYFGNQPMTNGPVYVGAFILLLAVLAMFVVDDPKFVPIKWALFAAMILSVLLAWGHNLEFFTNFFIDYFPAYNKFRAVASMLVVLEFCVPCLAILCLMKILSTPDFLQRYGTTSACVSGVFVLICFFGWVSPSIFGKPFSNSELEMLNAQGAMSDPAYSNVLSLISRARLDMISADSLRSLAFIIVGALVCWLYLKGILKNKTAFVLMLTAVMLIDLFTVNKRYVNHDNFVAASEAQSSLESTPADRQILRDKSHYRVMDIDGFGSARSSYFHNTIGGYHAAKLTRYNDLIERQIQKGNPGVLNMLNTKYVISGGKAETNPGALGNAWFVEKISYVATPDEEMTMLDTLPTATAAVADAKYSNILGKAAPKTPGDTIFLSSYAPNKLHYKYNSAKGGLAVFSEVYFPWGWQARVDGKPLEIGRVNYVLRALQLPAGSHDVEFVFDPQSLKVTNTIGITSMCIIYLLCALAIGYTAYRMVRSRKETDEKREVVK
ncbi:MAG: YfhO family protein [Clostridium sp.]|nr:YfhO family protein [Prevotella sp.]MCM1428586.1 YfhO family protein [Clostridium sp.]